MGGAGAATSSLHLLLRLYVHYVSASVRSLRNDHVRTLRSEAKAQMLRVNETSVFSEIYEIRNFRIEKEYDSSISF